MEEFEIVINKSDMKFNCAHFIAFKGFRCYIHSSIAPSFLTWSSSLSLGRERLHGHNYNMAVKVTGRYASPLLLRSSHTFHPNHLPTHRVLEQRNGRG